MPRLLNGQIWDTRAPAAIITAQNHEDFISDFAVDASGYHLVATGYVLWPPCVVVRRSVLCCAVLTIVLCRYHCVVAP